MLISRVNNLIVTISTSILVVLIGSCGSGLKVDLGGETSDGSGGGGSGSGSGGSGDNDSPKPPDPLDPYRPIIPPPDTNTTTPLPILDIHRTLSVQLGVDAVFDASTHSYKSSFFTSSTPSKDAPVLGHYTYAKDASPRVSGAGSILEATLTTPIYNTAVAGAGWSDDDVIDSIYIDEMVQHGGYYLVAAKYRNGEGKPDHQYLLLLKQGSSSVYHITPRDIYRGLGQGDVLPFVLSVGSSSRTTTASMPAFFMVRGGYLFYGLYTDFQGLGRATFSLYALPLADMEFVTHDTYLPSSVAREFVPKPSNLVATMKVDTLQGEYSSAGGYRFDPNNHIEVSDAGLVHIFGAMGVEVRRVTPNGIAYSSVVSFSSYRSLFEYIYQGTSVVFGGVLPASRGQNPLIPSYVVSHKGDIHYVGFNANDKTLGMASTVVAGGEYWFDHIYAGNSIYLAYLSSNTEANALKVQRVYDLSTAEGSFVFNSPVNQVRAKFVYTPQAEVEVLASEEYALFRRGNSVFYLAPSGSGSDEQAGVVEVQAVHVEATYHTGFDPKNGGSLYVFSPNGSKNIRYPLGEGLDAATKVAMPAINTEAACTMLEGFPRVVLDKSLVGYSCPENNKYYFYDASGFAPADPKKHSLYIYATMPIQLPAK